MGGGGLRVLRLEDVELRVLGLRVSGLGLQDFGLRVLR